MNYKAIITANNFLSIFILILIFFIYFCMPASAEQWRFSKIANDESYQFNYGWLDYKKEKQVLTFTLPKEALFNRFRGFKAYQSEVAKRTALRTVKMQLNAEPIKGISVNFQANKSENNADAAVKITGKNQLVINTAYKKIQSMQQQALMQYYSEHYFQPFKDHHDNIAIKVNYAEIAKGSVADFTPLSKIILDSVNIKNIRVVTNFVLGFVQSIPYSTLESRETSSGAGFNPPMKLLYENQGDCDSKATLTIALLRALMPRLKIMMVYIDNHVFIGINVATIPGDKTINYNNTLYVLAEPTGPRILALGNIFSDSEMAVDQGAYTTEEYRD